MMANDCSFMFPNPTELFGGIPFGEDEYRTASRQRWNDPGTRAKPSLDEVTGSGDTRASGWSIFSGNRAKLDPAAISNGSTEA